MKVTYIGPHAEGVTIADTAVFAKPGETVEVETELAERLLEQDTNWARPATKAAKVAEKENA